jgi:hypothetical protein
MAISPSNQPTNSPIVLAEISVAMNMIGAVLVAGEPVVDLFNLVVEGGVDNLVVEGAVDNLTEEGYVA